MRFARHILADRRKLAGLTCPALAELAGISAQALRNIEAGRSEPRPPTILALTNALGLDHDELWIREDVAA
jgi:transcriptional regulator with XRE-family HTH domain